MSNWKEIIKSGVESVEIYSSTWVKVNCFNKDIGVEVFAAIKSNYQSLGPEPVKYVKGTNYKDFRFKFESSADASSFLIALDDVRTGKASTASSASKLGARKTPEVVTLLPQPEEKPVLVNEDTTSPFSTADEEVEETVLENQNQDVALEGPSTAVPDEAAEAGEETVSGVKSKISKKTIIIAAVAVVVLVLLVVLLTKKRK